MELVDRSCQACEGGVAALHPDEADFLLEDQLPAWHRVGDWIHRDFALANFVAAVGFVRDVADLAEDEGHHPDVRIHGYRNVELKLQTHAARGLTENDFILAAKIDRLWGQIHA